MDNIQLCWLKIPVGITEAQMSKASETRDTGTFNAQQKITTCSWSFRFFVTRWSRAERPAHWDNNRGPWIEGLEWNMGRLVIVPHKQAVQTASCHSTRAFMKLYHYCQQLCNGCGFRIAQLTRGCIWFQGNLPDCNLLPSCTKVLGHGREDRPTPKIMKMGPIQKWTLRTSGRKYRFDLLWYNFIFHKE